MNNKFVVDEEGVFNIVEDEGIGINIVEDNAGQI